MARIAGVDLPRRKRLDIGLTYIYGIGRTPGADLCRAQYRPTMRTDELTEGKYRRFVDTSRPIFALRVTFAAKYK